MAPYDPVPDVRPVAQPPRRARWPWVLLAAALGALVLIAILLLSAPDRVRVPDVVGSSISVAQQRLEKAGFEVGAVRANSDKPTQPGHRAESGTGHDCRRGLARVTLNISDGPRITEVPDVVIGGTSGLGLSGAVALVAAGAKVVIVGRDGDKVIRATDQIGKNHCAGLALDACKPATAVDAIKTAIERFGRFDGLYHVAGGSGRSKGDGPLHEITDDGIDFTIDLNLKSVLYSNRAAVRQFLQQSTPGAVLNMGSVLGWSPSPKHFATHVYAATRGAIIGLTKAAAAYYAPYNIRFNAIAPALVETPMSERAVGDPRDPRVHSSQATARRRTDRHAKRPRRGGRVFPLRRIEVRDRPGAGGRRRVDRVGGRAARPRTLLRTTSNCNSMSPLDQYLAAARKLVDEVAAQRDKIAPGRRLVRRDDPRRADGARVRLRPQPDHGRGDVAALRLVSRLQSDRRAVADVSTTWSSAPTASGRRCSWRTSAGLAERILRNFDLSPQDSALVICSSGCNVVPIEMAEQFKRQGVKIVALVSLRHAEASESAATRAGEKLHDVADLVLDTGAPSGDAMVKIDGLETPVSPGSTVGGCLLVNCLKAEVADRLTRRATAESADCRGDRRAPAAASSSSNRPTTSTRIGWRSCMRR